MLNICGIMACDPNGIIGIDGKLPWSYPEETRHFSNMVNGHIMIMGYKTFIDTPKKLLDNCYNIVLSSKDNLQNSLNVKFVKSLDEIFKLELSSDKKIFMIGGAEIAKLFLQNNLINKFILTKIHKLYSGNVIFPLFMLENWPYEVIRTEKNFTIYKYFKPKL